MDSWTNKTYDVLLADDSPDDRFFLRKTVAHFARFRILAEVQDGAEAIAYLKGEVIFQDRAKYPLPQLLLLDLKMPRKDGFEVLQWLQSQSFPALTVAVLSGSTLENDQQRCRALGANAFYSKPAPGVKYDFMFQEIEALLDQRSAFIAGQKTRRLDAERPSI
jgi:CheY-like chemotaxis protein